MFNFFYFLILEAIVEIQSKLFNINIDVDKNI